MSYTGIKAIENTVRNPDRQSSVRFYERPYRYLKNYIYKKLLTVHKKNSHSANGASHVELRAREQMLAFI